MNKRIKELVQQTDAWCEQNLPANWTDDVDQYLPLWNAKFAELIIKECGVALSPMLRDMVSRGQAYDLIKQHFGVEE